MQRLKIIRWLLAAFAFLSIATATGQTQPIAPVSAETRDLADFNSRLASSGIDPDSPQGAMLRQYFSKLRRGGATQSSR
jgi:hypothetical protein